MRRNLTVVALALLLLLPAALLHADAPTADKDLDGDWEVVAMVRDGKEGTPPADAKPQVTIKGDAVTFKTGDASHKATIKIDASKSPKTIDLTPGDGPQEGKTMAGIYEIKGDELRVCHGEPDKARPSELSSKEGSGVMLITLKRIKK